jgi:N-acetylmuramoyl-L-alanine amidase
VIFDNKSGVQFTPTVNGSIYNTPSSESFLAAFEVLEGKRNAENALFFINPRYAKSSWVSRNRKYAFTLENHDFYY